MKIVKRYRHIDRWYQHGKLRYYFRIGHGPRLPLPGVPGSTEFEAAYEAALSGNAIPQRAPRHRGPEGSFDRLVEDYYQSQLYTTLAPSSQIAYRRVIDRWIRDERIGHRMVRDLKWHHVDRMLAKRTANPGAANDLLKKMRILMGFAIKKRWRSDDPTANVKKNPPGEGHRTWTDEEIATYEARWPLGTPERTAFALLLYTGQRLSDVVRMEWRHITTDPNGVRRIGVMPEKTRNSTRKRLHILLHEDLAAALDAWPKRHDAILTTQKNRPRTAAGFGGWMADKIAAAGLPEHCVTHGIRKAAVRRLVESGCPPHEIMAISGHSTLAEIQRYAEEYSRPMLGDAAIKRLMANKRSQT